MWTESVWTSSSQLNGPDLFQAFNCHKAINVANNFAESTFLRFTSWKTPVWFPRQLLRITGRRCSALNAKRHQPSYHIRKDYHLVQSNVQDGMSHMFQPWLYFFLVIVLSVSFLELPQPGRTRGWEKSDRKTRVAQTGFDLLCEAFKMQTDRECF